MRSVLSLAFASALVCQAVPLLAQSRTVEQTLPLNPGGALSLRATKGTVRLTAWDRADVQIRARIEATSRMSDDYAQRAVDATQVDIDAEPNRISIRSNYEAVSATWSGWGRDSGGLPDIHYEIQAPRSLRLSLDIDRSNSTIAGFEGRITIEADRSELRVNDVAGDVRVEIDRGGSSRFDNVRGSFSLEGDRTDIDLSLASLTDQGRLELDRGNARIRVAAGQPLTLRTDVERRGSFDSELPVQITGGTERSPEGTINGGGPTFTVVAHRARVTLRKM